MITLNDLLKINVSDDCPVIETLTPAISYQANFDSNFEDNGAFVSCNSKIIEEVKSINRFVTMLEEGKDFLLEIYSWRSLAKALPMTHSSDEMKPDLHLKTYELLKPQIAKLERFYKFTNTLVKEFSMEISRISHPERKREFISSRTLSTLALAVDNLMNLDITKDLRVSLKNDFTLYKRMDSVLSITTDIEGQKSLQNLTMFLGQRQEIFAMIIKEVCDVEENHEVISEIINNLCLTFENNEYIFPNEKFSIIRSICYLMLLLNHFKTITWSKLENKKKISLARIDKIFRECPVIPLFGDIQVNVVELIRKCSNFEPSKWSFGDVLFDQKTANNYSLTNYVDNISQEFTKYMNSFCLWKSHCNDNISTGLTNNNIQETQQVYDLAFEGLSLLCKWTCILMENFSWKMTHPCDSSSCPDNALDYEKHTRYNFKVNEKSAFVVVISLIRSLYNKLSSNENNMSPSINLSIHRSVQMLLQLDLRELLRKTCKNSKSIIFKMLLLSLRDTCCDYAPGMESDPAAKGDKSSFSVVLPSRSVAPSSTQIFIIRSILEMIVSSKSAFKKEIDTQCVNDINNFIHYSFFFHYTSNFCWSLKKACDLSHFWFREFFLEMASSTHVQFTIDCSIPWILTSHILESDDHLTEYILYIMDLYNDSAQCALLNFKKRYIFDEIRAEVNLCFEQLLYGLSESIFQHYKCLAGSIYFDKAVRSSISQLMEHIDRKKTSWDNCIPLQPSHRYSSLMGQKHFHLLGVQVDFSHLLSQRVILNIKKSIDLAISYFESGSINKVMALHSMLKINELTWSLLQKEWTLPSFDYLLREINSDINCRLSRVSLHVIWDLLNDFLPNSCYNSTTDRFVTTTQSFAPPVTRDPLPKCHAHFLWGSRALNTAYQNWVKMHANFFGFEHFDALIEILEYRGLTNVFEELRNVMLSLFQGPIGHYNKIMLEGLPPKIVLPRPEYGVNGILEYYNANMEPLINYRDMNSKVFHAFTSFGNAAIFIMLLEQAMGRNELYSLYIAAPSQGIFPGTLSNEKSTTIHKALNSSSIVKAIPISEQHYFEIASFVGNNGPPMLGTISKEAEILTRERMRCGLSIFSRVLCEIQPFLTSSSITTSEIPNLVECTEFFRLWSVLCYVIVQSANQNGAISSETLFGDGLLWAGAIILIVSDQLNRFEAVDFVRHLAYVSELPYNKEEFSAPVRRLILRSKRLLSLQKSIFLSINCYYQQSRKTCGEKLSLFLPPVYNNQRSKD